MGRRREHDVLFEPVPIGPRTLRNRFYQTPHAPGYGPGKPGTNARYHAVKAEGGWSAVFTGVTLFSPDTDIAPLVADWMMTAEDQRAYARMCEEAHEHGALAGIELAHIGTFAPIARDLRGPGSAPSAIANPTNPWTVPRALDVREIRRLQRAWAAAARRAIEAGFDIVLVYGGDGTLPAQFLSPWFNRRSDEYGGSLENRARFWLETLQLVREEVGTDAVVTTRLAADVTGPTGVHAEEVLEFMASADPLVDYWDVKMGETWETDTLPARWFPEGHQTRWTRRAREATQKPIVTVGRLTSPDLMAQLVRDGVCDLIGGARPSIADPFLPRKIEEGRYDEIRECVGANICAWRAMGNHLGCMQNPTVGEEHRRGWHPERFSRARNADSDVLVVGAGPAGMECAQVLARRGMRRVHLVDAAPEIGGHLRWVSTLPGLGTYGRIVNHRQILLGKLANVELIRGVRLSAAEVLDYGAEQVVIATGSHWARDGLNGFLYAPIDGVDADQPHVLTPEQLVVEGKRPPGERVLVYDTDGYYMGPCVAERLARDGFAVELATPFPVVAPFADLTLEGEHVRRGLHELGVKVHRGVVVTLLDGGTVGALDEHGEPLELPADAFVPVTQRVPDDGLWRELEAAGREAWAEAGVEGVHRIGDCVAPSLIGEAIFDGHRLAREIDSDDPSVALPFTPEHAPTAEAS